MTDQLLTVARVYCAARNRSLSYISTIVLNDGKKFDAIASGADLVTWRFEHAMQWFSDNWPEDAAWPKEIVRPLPPKVRS